MTIHLFQFNCNLFIGTFALNFYQLLSTVLLVYYWMLLFVMLFNKNVYRIYRRPLNESFISCCSIAFTTLYIIVVKSSSASRGLHPQNPRVLLSQKKFLATPLALDCLGRQADAVSDTVFILYCRLYNRLCELCKWAQPAPLTSVPCRSQCCWALC